MSSNKQEHVRTDKKVAVLVLNWNGRALLEQFAGNWESLTPEWAELIVVDNGSTDDSLEYLKAQHPSIKTLALGENYGFAEGYNRAIAQLEYPNVVLLNSDIALHEGWLDQPMELLDRYPEVVAVQPKLRAFRSPKHFEYAGAAGGYLDRWGYPYCAGRIFDTLEADHNQYDDIRPIMWASGACLIVRREAYLSAGGLDARFFAHQEEIDLCWRLKARGGEILLAPNSIVYHVGGASLDINNPRKTYLNFRNNLLMLYKNMPSWRFACLLVLRLVLDFVTLLRFLVGGKGQLAASVARAWRDALAMMPSMRGDRRTNLRAQTRPNSTILSPLSVVWAYYIEGRRHFSQLHKGDDIKTYNPS